MKKYDQFIEDVQSNPDKYSKTIRQLVARHLRDLERSTDLDFPYYFNEGYADHFINFAESLKHYEDRFRGKNILLEPWQAFFFAMLYGWVRKKDNIRKYKKVYIQIARKAGKSILGSVIVLYHLTFGKAEEIYSIATKRDQAKIIYKKIKGIVGEVPNAEKYVKIHLHDISIGDSTYMPMDAESKRADGFNPSVTIVDEYHAHKNDELVQVYQDGMGARSQPILFIITTAGYSKGACYDEYLRAKKILEGIFIDEAFLPMIFELEEDDEWEDESKWGKANPNLGVSVSMDFMREQFVEAQQKITKEISFKTKNLNLWTTDSEDTWIHQKVWELCKREFDYSLLKGRRCYGGIDLSGVSDLTGYSLYFPFDEFTVAIHKVYIPKGALEEKQRLENSSYLDWERDGHVIVTPGDVTNHAYLIDDLVLDAEEYEIIEVGYDPYKSGNIISFIEDEGIPMVPMKQGIKYFSEPCKAWEKKIKDRKIIDNSPVAEWCVSNAVVKPDNHENIIPLKKDGKKHNKIDLVVTSVIANKVMDDNEDGLREEKQKKNPLNVWAEGMKEKKDGKGTIKNENPLNRWAEEYLKTEVKNESALERDQGPDD